MNLKTDQKRLYTCHGCGLEHPDVEAGGLWHCPNPLCSGAGNHYFRTKLKSYKDHSTYHIVEDMWEWISRANLEIGSMTPESKQKAVVSVYKKSLKRLFKDYGMEL